MTQTTLDPVRNNGWRLGLRNMMRIEMHRWFGLRRWLRVALGWTIGIEGFVLLLSTVLPRVIQVIPDEPNQVMDGLTMGIQGHFQVGATAMTIGAILIGQGLLIKDQSNGVAEWLLAKPVSRASFFLGKLAANALGLTLLIVLLPSFISYFILSSVGGEWMQVAPYISSSLALVIHSLCYLCLAAMLSVLTGSRGAVLGILLPATLLSQLWGMLLGRWVVLTPWGLSATLAAPLVGAELPAGMLSRSLAATACWCLVASVVGLVSMHKAELV